MSMVWFGIAKLLFKVAFRLRFEYPRNFRSLKERIDFHSKTGPAGSGLNLRKLRFYSRVATISLACLEELQGKKAATNRRQAMLLGCGISPILDDLMDEKGYSGPEIGQLVQKKQVRGRMEERVVIGLMDDLDRVAPEIRRSEIWEEAIRFQIAGNQKSGRRLTRRELETATFGKGGNIVLLGMLASTPELVSSDDGRAAFFSLGSTIQFIDDLFDVWKDREDGQQTLVTNCGDVEELRLLFEKMTSETDALLRRLSLEKGRVELFLFEVRCFTSLGRVALRQLLEVQKRNSGLLEVEKHTRQELVTDMEKWRNRKEYLRLVLFN